MDFLHWQRLVRQSFGRVQNDAALREISICGKDMSTTYPEQQLQSDGTFKREFVNSIISVDYTGISNGTLYPAYFGDEVSFLSDGETIESYAATADKNAESLLPQNSYNTTAVLGARYTRVSRRR